MQNMVYFAAIKTMGELKMNNCPKCNEDIKEGEVKKKRRIYEK